MSRLKVSTPAAPNDVAPKGYVDDKVASAVSSVYRIKGSIPASSITASKLQDSEIGDVYNVIGTFITNDYFIEGVIETEHPSGSNIVVVLDANNVKK